MKMIDDVLHTSPMDICAKAFLLLQTYRSFYFWLIPIESAGARSFTFTVKKHKTKLEKATFV